MSTNQSALNEEVLITLGDLAGLLGRFWRFVLGGGIAGAVIATAIALATAHVYRAEVVAVFAEPLSGGDSLSRLASQSAVLTALAGAGLSSGDNRDETLAVLRSKQFALELIEQEELMPILFPDKWNFESGAWRSLPANEVPTQLDAWELFDKRIRTIIEDRDRGIVTLRIEMPDRVLAARIAGRTVDKLNETLRLRKLKELDESLAFLREEYESTNLLPLQDAISAVMRAQVSERMLATVRKDFALRVIDAAMVPDEDRYVRPKPAFMAALGVVVGALIGLAGGLALSYRRPSPAQPLQS